MTTEIEPVAGRELDALVAEKVMGINPDHIHTHRGGASFPSDASSTGWLDVAPISHYSTDIAAAFEVLNRIHSKEVPVEEFWPFSKRSLFYRELGNLCSLDELGTRLLVAWPDALGIFRDRMPEFICLAALKAVGA